MGLKQQEGYDLMSSFLEYSKEVFGQWRRAYGLLTFILLILSVVSGAGVDLVLPSPIWYLVLLVTLFIGTYRVYKQLEDSLPESADLALDLQSVQFGGSGWSRVLPTTPIRTILSIHLRNPGSDRIKLSDISIEEYELNSRLFEVRDTHVEINLAPPHGSRNRMTLPFDIPGRDWRAISLELPVAMTEKDPNRFLDLVRELSSFSLELSFGYENMDGESRTIPLQIEETYEGFRDAVRQNLIQRNQHEELNRLAGMLEQ